MSGAAGKRLAFYAMLASVASESAALDDSDERGMAPHPDIYVCTCRSHPDDRCSVHGWLREFAQGDPDA